VTYRSRTEKLLKENARLRDSDIYLWFAYAQEYHRFILTDQQKAKLSELPTFETITRVRRDLRAEYPGSDEVEKERYKKFVEYRDEYGRPYMKEE